MMADISPSTSTDADTEDKNRVSQLPLTSISSHCLILCFEL